MGEAVEPNELTQRFIEAWKRLAKRNSELLLVKVQELLGEPLEEIRGNRWSWRPSFLRIPQSLIFLIAAVLCTVLCGMSVLFERENTPAIMYGIFIVPLFMMGYYPWHGLVKNWHNVIFVCEEGIFWRFGKQGGAWPWKAIEKISLEQFTTDTLHMGPWFFVTKQSKLVYFVQDHKGDVLRLFDTRFPFETIGEFLSRECQTRGIPYSDNLDSPWIARGSSMH